MNRVVITGMGVLSACGNSVDVFWDHLSAGRSGLAPLTRLAPERVANNVAGEVRDFHSSQHFGKQGELLDRFAQLALVATRQALADAGLPARFGEAAEGPPATRVGVYTGSALGGAESQDTAYQQLYAKGASRVHPFSIPRCMMNAPSAHISMETGAQGPCLAVSTACASATHALGEAMRWLRAGMVDVVLAGGCDAPLSYGVIKAWEAMRVLAPAGDRPQAACRPFSMDRSGMVLAEGAAMFVLETEAHARARGARVRAELAGYGASADAGHITQPTVRGPLRAMQLAMQEAGFSAASLDYINAHGTGTRLNDSTEIAAIRELLGPHATQVSISSTKSMLGHAMGASGGLELAACVLALEHQLVPPTANFQAPDPECDLDVTPNVARARRVEAVLSNSFAFGGLNAVLALRRS
ncbi:MAG: beta-ketoacyl-[acyl-carrier-protein] synthase family protein [Terriglobales bacterium]